MKEVLLIILVVSMVVIFFGAIIGSYIHKKVHHLPTGDCACCHVSKKQILKEYHEMYNKNRNNYTL